MFPTWLQRKNPKKLLRRKTVKMVMKKHIRRFFTTLAFLVSFVGSYTLNAQITSNVLVGCLPTAAYSFTLNNPPANPVSVCWDLGDGLGFVCNNQYIAQGIYSSAGLKNIICRVETSPGVFSTFNGNITVNAFPNPSFRVDTNIFKSCGTPIRRVFTLIDTNNVNNVVWEIYNRLGTKVFSQSSTAFPFSVGYTFSTSDTFRVKAIVFDRTQCVKDTTLTFVFSITRNVQGNFSSNPGVKACLPANYTFTPNLSIPSGMIIDSARWTLTDMRATPPTYQVFLRTTSPTSPLTLPTFTTPGEYQVSLTVFSNGCSSSIASPFTSFRVDNAPTLSYTVNGGRTPVQVCLNQVFDLQNNTNTSSNLPGGTFTWDFYGLVKNTGAIRPTYKAAVAPGGSPSTGLAKYRYSNISPTDSGLNSVILKWNGACETVDTLKNIIRTKGPLSRIAIRNPFPPVSCDSPFIFQLIDTSSFKPAGHTYTNRWIRFAADNSTIIDSIIGTPRSILTDTISILGEKRFYQLRLVSSDGCEDVSTKISIQRAVSDALFANSPWVTQALGDTLDCSQLLDLKAAPAVVVPPPPVPNLPQIIPDPGNPVFQYKIEVFRPGNPSNVILTSGPSNWTNLQPIVLTDSFGAFVVRQVMGINPLLNRCTDTIEKTIYVKNFSVDWGRLVGGNVVPNPSGGCLGAGGAAFNQTFHVYEDVSQRWPAYNTPFEYIWTMTDPNGTQTAPVTTTTPSYTFNFNANGAYSISVTVKSKGGCVKIKTMSFEVGTIASIQASLNSGDSLIVCANADVTSVSASGSQGSTFTYRWAVYNATAGGLGTLVNTTLPNSPVFVSNLTDFNPTFRIKNNNPYYLVVTVTNDRGCTSTAQIIIRGSNITALMRPDTAMACPGYKTFLSYNSDAISYDWQFTDPIGNMGNPLVTTINNSFPLDSALGFFGIGGIKSVKLTVTSQYGCVDDTTININVGGPIPSLTVTTPSSKKGCDSLNVIIQDRSRNIDRYVFGWGDGSSNYSLGQTNSHVYQYPYSVKNDSLVKYVINLLAIGQNCVVPYSDTITVYPRPVVSGFTLSDSLCSPASFTINDTSRFAPNGNYGTGSNNTIYSWNFNDGSGWNAQTAPIAARSRTKSIATPGIYNVLLAVTNPWGCVDTGRVARIRVLDTPVANFYAVDSVKCWSNGSNGFIFNDASTYPNSPARSWRWYWTDPTAVPNAQNGYTTTGPSTGAVNFTVPGANTSTRHSIALVVTNAFGCSDSVAKPNYITVRDTIPPSPLSPKYITVDPLTLRNHVELNWGAVSVSDFLNYEIFRNNASIATITNSATTSYTDVIDVVAAGTSLNYKMRVNDICNQGSIFDTTHSTINVNVTGVATGGYATNNIAFNAYEGWGAQTVVDYYEIFRKKGSSGAFAPVGRLNPILGNTNYLYVDSGLCSDTFYYYVKVLHKNYADPRFGYYSISNYDSIISNFNVVSTPVEINFVSVNSTNQIAVQWTPAPLASGVLKQYLVERFDQNNPSSVVVYRGNSNSFVDNSVNASTTIYKYVVRYEDQCGNLSNYSDTSVNILAVSDKVKIANYDAYDMKIDWTPYSTWKNGVIRYDIEVKYPTGWRNIGSVPGNTLTFMDVNVPRNEIEGAYCYRVKAIENDAVPDSSISNETCIIYPSKILVPTAFTPNNDGLNDTLFVNGGGLKMYDFRVYDRWGKCVFQTDDITVGWNGRNQNTGDPCQSGIYSYTLVAKGQDFNRFNRKGIITLLK